MGCGGRCIRRIRDVPRRHPDGTLVIQGQHRDPRCHTKASSQRPGVAWTSSTSQLAPGTITRPGRTPWVRHARQRARHSHVRVDHSHGPRYDQRHHGRQPTASERVSGRRKPIQRCALQALLIRAVGRLSPTSVSCHWSTQRPGAHIPLTGRAPRDGPMLLAIAGGNI